MIRDEPFYAAATDCRYACFVNRANAPFLATFPALAAVGRLLRRHCSRLNHDDGPMEKYYVDEEAANVLAVAISQGVEPLEINVKNVHRILAYGHRIAKIK